MNNLLTSNQLEIIKNYEINNLKNNYHFKNAKLTATRDYFLIEYSLIIDTPFISKRKKRSLYSLGYVYKGLKIVNYKKISEYEFLNHIKKGNKNFNLKNPVFAHSFIKCEFISNTK